MRKYARCLAYKHGKRGLGRLRARILSLSSHSYPNQRPSNGGNVNATRVPEHGYPQGMTPTRHCASFRTFRSLSFSLSHPLGSHRNRKCSKDVIQKFIKSSEEPDSILSHSSSLVVHSSATLSIGSDDPYSPSDPSQSAHR